MLILADLWLLSRTQASGNHSGYLSVRYGEGQILEDSFDQLVDSEEAKKLASAAVWKDNGREEISAEQTGRKEKADCYSMKGQPEAVFGKTLRSGRYFLSSETGVCLLDEKTAIALFGVKDATGNEVKTGGKTYRITGILSGEDAVCIIPAEKGSTFDGVTVRRKLDNKSVQSVVSILEVYMGGSHGEVIDGQFYSATAKIVFAVNLAMLCALLCTAASVVAGKTTKPAVLSRSLSGAGWIMALLIIILGIAFSGLGRDYLPTYWSDFEFYSNLWKTKTEAVRMLATFQQFWPEQQMYNSWRQVMGAGAALVGIAALGTLYRIVVIQRCRLKRIIK